MKPSSGTRLGPYEVILPIGASQPMSPSRFFSSKT